MKMKTNGLLTFLATAMMGSTSGFSTIRPIIQTTFRTTLATTSKPTTTTLYLEDWVADMIDGELHRQGHKTEYENAWMAKNRGAVLQSLNVGGTTAMLDEDRIQEFRQIEKDKRLAKRNPQQYCADRCIATGNCDVYEDLFDFTPEEVMSFCNDCVLAEDEEQECEIPETFYDIENFDILKP